MTYQGGVHPTRFEIVLIAIAVAIGVLSLYVSW